MIVGELLGLIDTLVNDTSKPVYLVAKPKGGWIFELTCPVTNVLKDDIVFVSNAFSVHEKCMSVKTLVFALNKHSSHNEVVFEIYGADNNKVNEQIICESIEILQDVHIIECDDCVKIIINVSRVGNVNNTFTTNNEKENESQC